MKIGTFELTKKKATGDIIYCDGASEPITVSPSSEQYNAWNTLYNHVVKADNRMDELKAALEQIFPTIENANNEPVELTEEQKKQILVRGVAGLMRFFKEFEFEPNFRFLNTLSFKLSEPNGIEKAKEYIINYFSLMDNQYTNEVSHKCESGEFQKVMKDIQTYGTPKEHINTRFAVYYGSAGTGKTTIGMQESGNRCIICNSSMLPSDLMEDFVFSNGEPSFKKSILWECMEKGEPIVLDEINLLPFDSLRFLQGILDGKAEFDYKGHKVTITPGFKVIGTMNLSLGGMVYGLPEPLVDRCADLKKFALTPEQLIKAIIE